MIVAILLMMVEFPFVCVFETANESVCLINSVYAPSTCFYSLCYFSKYNLDLSLDDCVGKVCVFETALPTNESVCLCSINLLLLLFTISFGQIELIYHLMTMAILMMMVMFVCLKQPFLLIMSLCLFMLHQHGNKYKTFVGVIGD